jgi:hypothetical protein
VQVGYFRELQHCDDLRKRYGEAVYLQREVSLPVLPKRKSNLTSY